MKGLLLGANGLLGSELRRFLPEYSVCGRTELDLTDPHFSLPEDRWDWIINAAAYTAVDRAEAEPDLARTVNAQGPRRLASLARACGARLIHISTDFVFDGLTDRPYRETDEPSPLGVYGRTKREGEVAVLNEDDDNIVVRTAWLFGDGPCFPATILRLAKTGAPLRVVDDQRGSPSYAPDVAQAIALLIARSIPGGIYHAAGVKAMTWYDLATRTLRLWDPENPRSIEPIPTADFPTAAPRPAYSVLDGSRLLSLGWRPRTIDDALSDWIRRRRLL